MSAPSDDPVRAQPTVQWTGVCIDCADAEAVAAFYARLFGWEITASDGAGWMQLRDRRGGVGLNIQADPMYERPTWPEEPGQQQKMLHFEILVDDLDAAVALAVAAGGEVAPHQPPTRDPARLRVMLDPAGHPLCLFVSGE